MTVTKDEVRQILSRCVEPQIRILAPPTDQEWATLVDRFSWTLPKEMRHFIDLMAEYAFPGDILNVGAGPHNGNDSIEVVHELETRTNPSWKVEMVPFYSIGNGDYFCVSSAQGDISPVYYYFHDRETFEQTDANFECWIRGLPEFLA